jgi:hypothetical protein
MKFLILKQKPNFRYIRALDFSLSLLFCLSLLSLSLSEFSLNRIIRRAFVLLPPLLNVSLPLSFVLCPLPPSLLFISVLFKFHIQLLSSFKVYSFSSMFMPRKLLLVKNFCWYCKISRLDKKFINPRHFHRFPLINSSTW